MLRNVALVIALMLFLLIVSCSRSTGVSQDALPPQTKMAVQEAIKVLRKLDVAIELDGRKYAIDTAYKYSALLIEAKAAADTATEKLPEGGLKKALSETMNCHLDARKIINDTILGWVRAESDSGKLLREKYKLQPTYAQGLKYWIFDTNDSVKVIWALASENLREAIKLTEQG